jgi:hypothetical protein
MDRFPAKVAELERPVRRRDDIAVERSADQLEEIQAASQRHSRFVTSHRCIAVGEPYDERNFAWF